VVIQELMPRTEQRNRGAKALRRGLTEQEKPHWRRGKGAGIKAEDSMTARGCGHYELDQGKRFTKEQKRLCWDEVSDRWAAYRLKKYCVPAARIEESA